MQYKDRKLIVDNINKGIEYIKGFSNLYAYIQKHYQEFIVDGEHEDNSVELALNYTMLKKIADDNDFIEKLNFVLNGYVEIDRDDTREKKLELRLKDIIRVIRDGQTENDIVPDNIIYTQRFGTRYIEHLEDALKE